jgi:hypothetical protein
MMSNSSIADVSEQFENAIYQMTWAEGQEMSLEQAVANALEED